MAFKSDLPFGPHRGSTLKAAFDGRTRQQSNTAKVQFSLGDFALTSVSLPLLPFVYFVLTPVDSSAAFNPLGEFPSIFQPFKVNAAIRNAFQRF